MNNEKLNNISTEQRNNKTINIDKLLTIEKLRLINDEDQTVAPIVRTQLKEISELVDACVKILKQGGRIIYLGAGTSGRLGILDASEIFPTYGEKNLFIGLIAGGKEAIQNPVENAEDDEHRAISDLESINFNSNDILIGIAASGRTPYVVSGLKYAKKNGSVAASISTSKNALISKISDIAIEANVGPEPITGSTRMKSGTAQKLILNMISTVTMISMGKVYTNYMVDVKATNEKLLYRAIKMISEITGLKAEKAKEYFKNSGENVKVAIVMYLKNITKNDALKLIKNNDGILRKIID